MLYTIHQIAADFEKFENISIGVDEVRPAVSGYIDSRFVKLYSEFCTSDMAGIEAFHKLDQEEKFQIFSEEYMLPRINIEPYSGLNMYFYVYGDEGFNFVKNIINKIDSVKEFYLNNPIPLKVQAVLLVDSNYNFITISRKDITSLRNFTMLY